MSSFRTYGGGLFVILIIACGHTAFEDLPATNDGLSNDAGSTGLDGSGGTNPDGNVGPTDAAPDTSNPILDGGRIDGGCATNCQGVFVSSTAGRSGATGTAADPLKSISDGVRMASGKPDGQRDVFVLAGVYTEKLTLEKGVRVLGGFSCTVDPCDWQRLRPLAPTKIVNGDAQGIVAPRSVGRDTVLEGFTIEASTQNAGGVSTAMTIKGSPTIAQNIILGATHAQIQNSYGVIIEPPNGEGPYFDSCTIIAQDAGLQSIGVAIEGPTTPNAGETIISRSRIWSRNAQTSRGILARNALKITNSRVVAGSGSGGGSWGIQTEADSKIDATYVNLTLDEPNTASLIVPTPSCEGNAWCGGIQARGAVFSITNNIVLGVRSRMSTALFLGDLDATHIGSASVGSNTLEALGNGATDEPSQSSAIVTQALAPSQGANHSIGNVRNTILIGGRNLNRFGVLEIPENGGGAVHLASLVNNGLYFEQAPNRTDYAYRYWDGVGQKFYILEQLEGKLGTVMTISNNFQAQGPQLDARYHLLPASDFRNKGTTLSLTNLEFQLDIDEERRAQQGPIDVGADERD